MTTKKQLKSVALGYGPVCALKLKNQRTLEENCDEMPQDEWEAITNER